MVGTMNWMPSTIQNPNTIGIRAPTFQLLACLCLCAVLETGLNHSCNCLQSLLHICSEHYEPAEKEEKKETGKKKDADKKTEEKKEEAGPPGIFWLTDIL